MKELSGIGKRECIIPQNVIVTNFPTIRHGAIAPFVDKSWGQLQRFAKEPVSNSAEVSR